MKIKTSNYLEDVLKKLKEPALADINKTAERAENVKRVNRTEPVYNPPHIDYERVF